jgi:hypothetical protein
LTHTWYGLREATDDEFPRHDGQPITVRLWQRSHPGVYHYPVSTGKHVVSVTVSYDWGETTFTMLVRAHQITRAAEKAA